MRPRNVGKDHGTEQENLLSPKSRSYRTFGDDTTASGSSSHISLQTSGSVSPIKVAPALEPKTFDQRASAGHDKAEHGGELSEEELATEKKLLHRIDTRIMPLVVLVYLMNCIDRNNYAAARLQGLEKSLNLRGNQYQIGLSILFISYILGQVPSNLILNWFGRPSLYLGFFTVAWGLVSACTSQVKGFGGIVVCRFVLGLVEAPFFPGVLFYLSKWYTKKELAFRMSIFYSGSLVSGAFGNLIAAGILHRMDGTRGMEAWQWLYIIEGAITVLIGLCVIFILPDFPSTWRALSPETARIATRRLAIDAASADNDELSQLQGLALALSDPKTYILALAYMCMTAASGFQNFFPTLTATLGYSHTDSLLLVAPPYIFMVFYSLGHAWMSDRCGSRFWFLVYPIPITITGFLIFMNTDSFAPRYGSFFLMIFTFSMNPTIFAWISTSLPRPPAKRAAALAIMNSLGNSASIWTPFTYRTQDAPHYRLALGIAIALQSVTACLALMLRTYLQRQNRGLAALESEDEMLTEEDLARLRRTAEVEGVDSGRAGTARRGYRYMI